MKSKHLSGALSGAALIVVLLVSGPLGRAAQTATLDSPSGRLTVEINYGDGLRYAVKLGDQQIVAPSRIDLDVKSKGHLATGGNAKIATGTKRETIEFTVPRKFPRLEVEYNSLTLTFPSGGAVEFRAYDEGVAYRWSTKLPGEIEVADEQAEFCFPADARAWFPEEESITTHQERVYKHLPLKEIGPERFCSTGMLVELANNRKVYISESDLTSYPGMFLRGVGGGEAGLVGKYSPYALETKAQNDRNVPVTKAADCLAKTAGTRTFPWRVMIVVDQDIDLLKSELIFALAPPLALEDASWIKPGKVAWDWWNDLQLTGVDFHAGINTATYKAYIDFAADYGLDYIVLDEGWSADTKNILEARPEIDLAELVRYGEGKNVRVILWVIWSSLDAHLIEALDKYAKLGVAGVKIDFMQRDDQWMVDYYERVAREAAKRKLLVDFHGAYKPTGLRRTYPNVITREGVAGLEQCKWVGDKIGPDHDLTLPFIRMVAGPMDFTPGAMRNADRASWRPIFSHPMSMGTRCHQLAMYVIYESPLQMLSDTPSAYRREPTSMKFLSAVPTVWDDIRPLAGKVGDYVAIARRSGDEWYLGAMTDWTPRELSMTLDFLPAGTHEIEIWQDGVNADRDATDMKYETRKVTRDETLDAKMAPGGGWAARIHATRSTAR